MKDYFRSFLLITFLIITFVLADQEQYQEQALAQESLENQNDSQASLAQ